MATSGDNKGGRSEANDGAIFKHHRTTPNRLTPGPGRRYDRRHFRRIASGDTIMMTIMVAVILFWFAVELGICPDVFGWHKMPER
tara:strand:+ start:12497 stop:12751 length:255 start_codon:yes stop_codon:yes gene_type:complete